MHLRSMAGVVGTALVLGSAPALADPASDLRAKLNSATAAVSSFQIEMSVPNAAGGGVVTIDRTNKRAKSSMSFGAATVDTLSDGTTVYVRVNGGNWIARSVPQATTNAMVSSIDESTKLEPLPDTTEAGTTVGAVRMTGRPPVALGAAASSSVTMTCTYDKTTYRLRTCTMPLPQAPSMGDISMTFGHFNDPANVVTIPAGMPSPIPLALPTTPAPSAPSATATPAAK